MVNKKMLTAVAWAIASCMFLWLFSLAQTGSMSSPPVAGELFQSFFHFTFMIIGGGVCYHFLTELLSSPYAPENGDIWSSLMRHMIAMMSILLSAPIIILLLRDYIGSASWLLSLAYLTFALCASLWLGVKIKPLFTSINSKSAAN